MCGEPRQRPAREQGAGAPEAGCACAAQPLPLPAQGFHSAPTPTPDHSALCPEVPAFFLPVGFLCTASLFPPSPICPPWATKLSPNPSIPSTLALPVPLGPYSGRTCLAKAFLSVVNLLMDDNVSIGYSWSHTWILAGVFET